MDTDKKNRTVNTVGTGITEGTGITVQRGQKT